MLLMVGACAPSPEAAKPEKERVFKIGCFDPMTGIAATPLNETVWAADLAAHYLNDQGGIGGVKVKVLHTDTRYDPALAMSAYKKYVERDKIFATCSWSSGESALFKPIAARDKVVVWGVASPLAMWPAEGNYVFSDYAGYPIFYEAYLNWYLKNVWKDATRKPTVAGAFMDAPAGKDGEVAAKNACKFTGLQYLGSEWVPMGATDTSTQILALKDRKPDVVIYLHIGVSFASFVRDAFRLGLTKQSQLYCHFYIVNPYIIDSTGYEPWQGVHGYTNWALFTDDTEGVKIVKEMIAKYKPDWGPVETIQERAGPFMTFRDWTKICALSEAYRIAMAKVGYDNMNGEALRDALETLKDYTAFGAAPPITFGKDRRIGCIENALRVVEVTPGKNYSRAISDWVGLTRQLTPEERTSEYWTQFK